MNEKKYRWILYLISTTIVMTIAIQCFWNYKNFQENKQRVINEIQISFDQAIEAYYAELSKRHYVAITKADDYSMEMNHHHHSDQHLSNMNGSHPIHHHQEEHSISKWLDRPSNDSITISNISISIKTDNEQEYDSMLQATKLGKFIKSLQQTVADTSAIRNQEFTIHRGKNKQDSLQLLKGINTIFIAYQNDSIDFKVMDSIFEEALQNKRIYSTFYFDHYMEDRSIKTNKSVELSQTSLQFEGKSTYLKPQERLLVHYENPFNEALQRSMSGILLSFLLSLAVISSLFYMLKIINKQKALAEIKNDLISNITHEFKTPITTVSTAIEAMKSFNALNDPKKTNSYLTIADQQLNKLSLMVEKLLETATLDSEQLVIKKESIALNDLIEKIIQYHQSNKTISFIPSSEPIRLVVDPFHFENALNNLVDNALKYGGDQINIHCTKNNSTVHITVSDNGKGVDKKQQEKIFEKFYRIPTGNTHNVKGFGIGLYYTHKIIQKHNGDLTLESKPGLTSFKISIPNEKEH